MKGSHLARIQPGGGVRFGFHRSLIFLIAFLAATGGTAFGQANPVSPADGAWHKIRVRDAAQGAQILAQGGQLVADYGTFQLYETPQAAAVLAALPAAEIRDEYNVVTLNTGHLDTRKPEVKALRTAVGSFEGRRMHLVQFAGPVRPEWHDELLAAGVRIVSYIPQNAYLVYGDAPAIARVQMLATLAPHIQWEAAYLDQYKINPAASPVDENGNARNIGTDEFAVQMVADAEANDATLQLLNQLKLGPMKYPAAAAGYSNVVVRIAAGNLGYVAARPDVVSISPNFRPRMWDERQDQIIAGNLTGNLPTGPGYLAWLAGKGFTQAQFNASGFVVDVSDSGIDNGTTMPGHFGLYQGGTLGGTSRVAYNRLEGFPNSGSSLQGCDGHGNLNSHIVGGYDDLPGFPFADSAGFHYGLGVCPFVNVGSSVIFDPEEFTFPDFNMLQSDAYGSGARVSSNSWGEEESDGIYDSAAQTYDALVRDAQSATTGNQEMVIVFAAGNDGPSSQTVSSPGSAKNVITVGAAENVQPFGGPDGSGIGDDGANSANDIIFFSSRGPTTDGRHKPEIVAPGTHVSGGVPQATPAGTTGKAIICFTGDGVSGGVNGSSYWPSPPPTQQFYTASSGTSHSTPCVAGACALLRQYFINNFTNPPSAAMTKAYLMNSARYMTGMYANDTLWSDNQGMGELNLGTAFDGGTRVLRDELPADLFTMSGQARTFTGLIVNTNQPFRVTVAWTDAPGSTSGNSYNNDLDLTVTVGGVTYKGNVFSGAYSTTGGNADLVNNAESVFLPAGLSGAFQVTVTAANINSVGVPNTGNTNEQDFALVIYNGTTSPAPIITATGTALTAESCTPTNGSVDPGETVSMTFTLQNIGLLNASNLVATLQTSGGVIALSAPQTYGAMPIGGAAVTLPFTFSAPLGACGSTFSATLQLQDGTNNLGLLPIPMTLGQLIPAATYSENFDEVNAPSLPTGWTTTGSGDEEPWTTAIVIRNTPPNSAFAPDFSSVGLTELISPSIAILSPSAQLTFRNNYNLDAAIRPNTLAFDGGVLEISIGGGSFSDILAAGGSFVTGGYNRTITLTNSNPLAGRPAWSGNSHGFITTTINLPASAAGKHVVFKWRCGTGNNDDNGAPGWYIDTISVVDGVYTCCAGTVDLGLTQSAAPSPAQVGQNISYQFTITNSGTTAAAGVTLQDTLPGNASFVAASPGFTNFGGTVIGSIGTLAVLPANAAGNVIITVSPTGAGPFTNVATVFTSSTDVNLANNSSTNIFSLSAPPTISGITVVPGTVSISVPTQMGTSYTLEYKNTLTDPSWTPVGLTVPGTGGVIVLQDTSTLPASRYYHVRLN